MTLINLKQKIKKKMPFLEKKSKNGVK